MKTNHSQITFPVGYHQFHKTQFFNFQLNRWCSVGLARHEDMLEAGRNIKKYEDWKPEMVSIAEKAVRENRLLNAAIYYRSAEFYTLYQDPDKEMLYDKFIEYFYQALESDNIQRFKVPYQDAYLPAIKVLPNGEKKGTILLHGGYDSFLEEWYLMLKYLAVQGYEVIGFEGPGQGAALIKAGLAMDVHWEKPTGVILDYFDIDDVTLFGLSMGGWLCLRAAAFEPRIKRVVASGHAIHYMDIVPAAIGWIFEFFMRYEKIFNKSAFMKMEQNPRMKWEIGNTMRITKSETPFEGAQLNLSLSRKNMSAEQIRQDVLILSGEEDHFIPIRLHNQQVAALSNAKSVTDHIFTKTEHAQNHCQIGNVGLMLDTLIQWIEELDDKRS
jgi:pimeloyl-ACP methyl ester carboxylesterase